MPFRTALREVTELREITLCLQGGDGLQGWGSVVPTPAITGDTEAKIRSDLNTITARLCAVDMDHPSQWRNACGDLEGLSNSALAAVDVALCDLAARRARQPLWRWLSLGECRPLQTNMTISVDTPDVMASRAQEALQRGFKALKIKVGGQGAALDQARVAAVRAAVGPSVTLRLDANQGWVESEAQELITWFSHTCAPIDFIEQPVPAGEIAALKRLADQSSVPVMADESAMTFEQASEVLRTGAARALSVKIIKAGGLLNAKRILDLAQEYQVPCLMSCMFEVGAGLQAAVHLASVHPAVQWIDLDPVEYLRELPYSGGVRFSGPEIVCGVGHGLDLVGL